MKKNFFKYMLLGAFTLALGVGFVGCKDYDEDIDDLYAKLQQAQTSLSALESSIAAKADKSYVDQAKADAIAQAKALIDAITPGDSEALKALAAQLDALEIVVAGLDADAIAAQKALLDLQMAALEKYGFVNDEGDADFDAAYEALAAAQDLSELLTPEKLAQLAELVDQIDPLLNILGDVNSMITGIGATNEGVFAFDFRTSEVLAETFTFGQGLEGAMTFTKGTIQKAIKDNTVVLQVNPVNAKLTVEQLSLHNSKLADVISLLDVTVKPFDELITRAVPSTNGLWSVTFDLPANPDAEALVAAAYVDAKALPLERIAYALSVVDDLEGGQDRQVTTGYAFTFDAGDAAALYTLNNVMAGQTNPQTNLFAPISLLSNAKNYNNIVEDKKWKAFSAPAVVPSATEKDDRTSKVVVSARVGEDLLLTSLPLEAVAYYVTFDNTRATAAQLAAWKSYGITGLDKVIPASGFQTALRPDTLAIGLSSVIPVNYPVGNPQATQIGFNLFAVNANGYLIDPDGMSFWIQPTAAAVPPIAPGAQLDFVYTFVSNITTAATYADTVAFDLSALMSAPELASVNKLEFSGLALDQYNGASGPAPVIAFLDKDKAPLNVVGVNATVADFPKIKFAVLNNVQPRFMVAEKVYDEVSADVKATVIFYNNQYPLVSATVSAMKEKIGSLFQTAPMALKPGITAANKVLDVIAIKNGTDAEFKLDNFLTFVPSTSFDPITDAGFFEFTDNTKVADRKFSYTTTTLGTGNTVSSTGTYSVAAADDAKKIGSTEFAFLTRYNMGMYDNTVANNNTYATWADAPATKIKLSSSAQKAGPMTWSNVDNYVSGPAAGKTRTWFVIDGNASPSNPRLEINLTNFLTVLDPLGAGSFSWKTTTGASPTPYAPITAADWVAINGGRITDVEVGFTTDGSVVAMDNTYFTPVLYGDGTDMILLINQNTVAIPANLQEVNMTLVFRVTDEFGNKTDWTSAGIFKAIRSAAQFTPDPIP